MRRRRLLAVLGAVLAGGAGVYAWDQLRFPARAVELPGTPVVLRVQASVDDRSLALVRDGIADMHRYLAAAVGGAQQRPVQARVAASNPCAPFAALLGFTSAGLADRDTLCLDTQNDSWPTLAAGDGLQARLLAAHEYAHTWQSENGCYFDEVDHTHLWLFEGTATYLAWQALLRSGAATRAQLGENLRFYDAARPAAPPLREYERRSPAGEDSDELYARWHLAVRRLAADARDGDRSLLRFCAAVATDRDWRTAFAGAFGVTVEDFSARFDEA